jgi:hypothetical protein
MAREKIVGENARLAKETVRIEAFVISLLLRAVLVSWAKYSLAD